MNFFPPADVFYRMVALGIFDKLWWKYMPGPTIKVKWPSNAESADPNDVYRPTLERLVGKQGWDWNWRVWYNDVNDNTISIKFRTGKEKYATLLALQWS